jgi:hypothetical protein
MTANKLSCYFCNDDLKGVCKQCGRGVCKAHSLLLTNEKVGSGKIYELLCTECEKINRIPSPITG